MQTEVRRKELVYPDLSYKIVGILFDVYNELGFGYSESHYQKAIAISLRENNIKFKEQVYLPIQFKNEIIGKYFLDYLIEDKAILEIKKEAKFSKKNIDQVNNYLKSFNKKLAILANFDKSGIKFKRLVYLN